MSAQPDTVTTLETIEHLDFKPETPCEYSLHQALPAHPANFLIRFACIDCDRAGVLGICADTWVWAARQQLMCIACGAIMSRDEGWAIVEVLS